MFDERTQTIRSWLDTFTGINGEPANDAEFYLLKAMWVMMLSEFEGSIKDIAEAYIDNIKTLPINDIHICLLLQNFYPNAEEKLTINNVLSVFKKDPTGISYTHFTRNRKTKYKYEPVVKLFNTLGIFFSDEESADLKALDAIASTRDSIAHGDHQIQITKSEIINRLIEMENIFTMLQSKLE